MFVFGKQAGGPSGELAFNLQYVNLFLNPSQRGIEMGCGCTPLCDRPCFHIDISPQPIAVDLVGEDNFKQLDASKLDERAFAYKFDWIFSSHMVEDLATKEDIIKCLNNWSTLLNDKGHLVLLLPDMQGGRYPTVAEGGNPSHRVDVGKEFIFSILNKLPRLELIQIDTIDHEKSCTIDVVFIKR